MPSPFPGMDPYIEGQMWEDFHHELISEIRHELVPQLRPKYVPRVELRIYVERAEQPPKSIAGACPTRCRSFQFRSPRTTPMPSSIWRRFSTSSTIERDTMRHSTTIGPLSRP